MPRTANRKRWTRFPQRANISRFLAWGGGAAGPTLVWGVLRRSARGCILSAGGRTVRLSSKVQMGLVCSDAVQFGFVEVVGEDEAAECPEAEDHCEQDAEDLAGDEVGYGLGDGSDVGHSEVE